MNATAPAAEPVTLDPVYVLRDEIAQSYPAVNGFERMLVLAAAQARLRYQEALNFERRVYQQTDPLELLSQSIDKFKTVLRFVADCERAWRRSLADVRSTSPAMLPPRGILLFQLPNRPLFPGIHHRFRGCSITGCAGPWCRVRECKLNFKLRAGGVLGFA